MGPVACVHYQHADVNKIIINENTPQMKISLHYETDVASNDVFFTRYINKTPNTNDANNILCFFPFE